jgi:DNA topoisomerase VI subunit B
MSAVLQRETFVTSRELEYFSTKELRAQIGYSRKHWPVAILRELIDNALDAIEVSGGLPEIDITIANDRITIENNGPGIPATTLAKSLDYLVRVSDKAYYTSSTRGQMGNALKTVWAAPFVATGRSVAEVHSHGQIHYRGPGPYRPKTANPARSQTGSYKKRDFAFPSLGKFIKLTFGSGRGFLQR